MPLPLIVPLAIIAASSFVGTAGVVSAVEKNRQAREVQETAEEILRKANTDMEYYRNSTKKCFENLGKAKLSVTANQLNDFVKYYSKLKGVNLLDSDGTNELDKMDLSDKEIAEMKKISTEASKIIGGGIAGVGTGALIGWGVYGGVSTLALAGNGAAIGALHGIAATNATLAWIGGGTLAAGGLGVAGGTVILGGLIAAPALALMGGLAGIAAGQKLDNAYTNKAEAEKISEQVYTSGKTLHFFCEIAVIIRKNLERLGHKLDRANSTLAQITSEKNNWHELTEDEKHSVAIAVKYAMAIKNFVDMPILTENGVLTKEAESFFKDYSQSAKEVYRGETPKIKAQEVLEWKEENVDTPNEYMCIIDPVINHSLLRNIVLPDCPPEKYLVFASVDKQSKEIACYAVVDRNAVDLNDIQNILNK